MHAGGDDMMGDGDYHFVEDAILPQEITVPSAVSHQNEEEGLREPLLHSVRWKWPRLHRLRHWRISLAQVRGAGFVHERT